MNEEYLKVTIGQDESMEAECHIHTQPRAGSWVCTSTGLDWGTLGGRCVRMLSCEIVFLRTICLCVCVCMCVFVSVCVRAFVRARARMCMSVGVLVVMALHARRAASWLSRCQG